MLGWCSVHPQLAACDRQDLAAELGVPAGANGALRIWEEQGCGDSEPAEPGRPALPRWVRVPPVGLRRLQSPVSPAGRVDSSLERACPTPTESSTRAAPAWPLQTPPTPSQPLLPPGMQCQHGLTEKGVQCRQDTMLMEPRSSHKAAPGAHTLLAVARDPSAQAQPCNASPSGTAVHGGCPSPITHCLPCGRGMGFGCARAQESLRSFPRHTHPGFNRTAGKREGGKEWDRYLSWWASQVWSRACPHEPVVHDVNLVRSRSLAV